MAKGMDKHRASMLSKPPYPGINLLFMQKVEDIDLMFGMHCASMLSKPPCPGINTKQGTKLGPRLGVCVTSIHQAGLGACLDPTAGQITQGCCVLHKGILVTTHPAPLHG